MTPRQRRIALLGVVVAGVAVAATLALRAFNENLLYFYSPTQVAQGEAPAERAFRIGGMVAAGSVRRETGSLTVAFVVTDFQHEITVNYTGVLPDLFREGQGVVARGRVVADGVFAAEEVLAKHDENYMPPEVADTLHHPGASAQAPAE
jgi:cytochrome c-type biogenesis protein CcmE